MILSVDDLERCREIAEAGARKVKPFVNAVSEATGIPAHLFYGRRRTAHISQARQLVYFLAHQSGISLSDIGRAMNRDHTTIMHGVQREKKRRETMQSGDKGFSIPGDAAKIERHGEGLAPLTVPNQSEPYRRSEPMADASQYTDSSTYFNAERCGNGGMP